MSRMIPLRMKTTAAKLVAMGWLMAHLDSLSGLHDGLLGILLMFCPSR